MEGLGPKGVASQSSACISEAVCPHGVQFSSAAPRAPGPMALLVADDGVAESGILSLPNHRIVKDGGGADSPVLLLSNIRQVTM